MKKSCYLIDKNEIEKAVRESKDGFFRDEKQFGWPIDGEDEIQAAKNKQKKKSGGKSNKKSPLAKKMRFELINSRVKEVLAYHDSDGNGKIDAMELWRSVAQANVLFAWSKNLERINDLREFKRNNPSQFSKNKKNLLKKYESDMEIYEQIKHGGIFPPTPDDLGVKLEEITEEEEELAGLDKNELYKNEL